MSLFLHDTATRSTRAFQPLEPGHVTMYVCGATVQGAPHIGHVRSSVAFDVVRRWMEFLGYQVTLCRNVTDIDDKILDKAVLEQRPWWAVATAYERAFTDAYRILGCLPPTVEPRATGHIPHILSLISRLIDGGHAYAVNGDVYFSVETFPRYGQLSGQKPDEVLAASDEGPKRDSRDFALWKSAKPTEPAWDSPWGPGRPGWHIECSAMATTYLGPEFDIHGGGRDLEFPHHENEIAQSQAAGDGFARYWLHNGWVTTAGEKMSKSLGNSLLVTEVVKRVRPIELRWYLGSAHYRSTLEYSEAALAESAQGFARIESFLNRVADQADIPLTDSVPDEFSEAMNDDINVPAAIAVIHAWVTRGNKETQLDAQLAIASTVRTMLSVLGTDPFAAQWQSDDNREHGILDTLIINLLEQRQTARQAKDFATADMIRDRLFAAGIRIDDTPQGPRWSLASHQEA